MRPPGGGGGWRGGGEAGGRGGGAHVTQHAPARRAGQCRDSGGDLHREPDVARVVAAQCRAVGRQRLHAHGHAHGHRMRAACHMRMHMCIACARVRMCVRACTFWRVHGVCMACARRAQAAPLRARRGAQRWPSARGMHSTGVGGPESGGARRAARLRPCEQTRRVRGAPSGAGAGGWGRGLGARRAGARLERARAGRAPRCSSKAIVVGMPWTCHAYLR